MSSHRIIAERPAFASYQRVASSILGELPGGGQVKVYTLTNANGLACKIMDYGACVTQFHVPDRDGRFADVVLGYSNLKGYLESDGYFGATIGRVANRITGGQFMLDGKVCHLSTNDGCNHIHGGFCGFDKVLWEAMPIVYQDSATLVLNYTSRDGEEGYPGSLSARVCYTLTDQDEFKIDYDATADRVTPINLTNHTYFNLAGSGTVLNHVLGLEAGHFTPLDAFHLPVGEVLPVDGTIADFRFPATIASRSERLSEPKHGFNHNFVLNSKDKRVASAARLHEPESGRTLEILTDQPAVQLYTGAYLKSTPLGKGGAAYGPYSGLCLETQGFPDAVNRPGFPSIILRPGAKYRHQTIWKFSTM